MRVIAHDELGPVAANDEVDERKRGADRRDHIDEQVDPLRSREPRVDRAMQTHPRAHATPAHTRAHAHALATRGEAACMRAVEQRATGAGS